MEEDLQQRSWQSKVAIDSSEQLVLVMAQCKTLNITATFSPLGTGILSKDGMPNPTFKCLLW